MADTNATAAAIPDAAMIESLRQEKRRRAEELHQQILEYAANVGRSQVQLGRVLKPMRDDALFKSLQPPYISWKEYLEQGVGVAHVQVLKWILVGEHYSDPQVEKHGIERLHRLANIQLKRKQPIPSDLDGFVLEFDNGEKRPFAELSVRALDEVLRFGQPMSGEPYAQADTSEISEHDAALNAKIGGDEHAWAELVRGELHGLDVEVDVKPGRRGPRVLFSVDFDQIRTFMRLLPERGLIVDLPDSVEPHE